MEYRNPLTIEQRKMCRELAYLDMVLMKAKIRTKGFIAANSHYDAMIILPDGERILVERTTPEELRIKRDLAQRFNISTAGLADF